MLTQKHKLPIFYEWLLVKATKSIKNLQITKLCEFSPRIVTSDDRKVGVPR